MQLPYEDQRRVGRNEPMRKRRRSHKSGPVRAKKVEYDGIKFASGLERYMYKALKEAGIPNEYEGCTYVLQEGFLFESQAYEKQANGKGAMINRGEKKILPIKYTPDFIGEGFIIETKGRANESFPLRWKMFKRWIQENEPGTLLIKPQNQKDCDETIKILKAFIRPTKAKPKTKKTKP